VQSTSEILVIGVYAGLRGRAGMSSSRVGIGKHAPPKPAAHAAALWRKGRPIASKKPVCDNRLILPDFYDPNTRRG
jgi:hypothetical protein